MKTNYTRSDFQFKTFIPGSNNAFPFYLLQKIPNCIEKNIIFIYGETGLGKTHLLQSVKNKRYKNIKKSTICYINGEMFTNDCVAAVKEKLDIFEKYKNLNIFLFDDIDCISFRDYTQKCLLQIITELKKRNALIVFSSHVPIRQLNGFNQTLKDYITTGFQVDLVPPDYETRKQIILLKLFQCQKILETSIVEQIAHCEIKDIRKLEACICKCVSLQELMNKNLSDEKINEILTEVTK